MGRKPTNKERKNNTTKRNLWIRKLYPYFKQNGLLGFSMDDVAQFLGVSKATIYNHFVSKEEIIDLFLDLKISEFEGFEEILEDSEISFEDKYVKALKFLVVQMIDVSPSVRVDLTKVFPEKWEEFEKHLNSALDSLGAHYQQGISDGMYKPVNIALMLLCDRNLLMFISDENTLSAAEVEPLLAFEQYISIRKNGLLKAPGMM
jgi:AcrR family transcriptional regulator